MDINTRIEEFERKTKNIAIAYGGDGTLLQKFHELLDDNGCPKKAILPIRNYGQCKHHLHLIDDVLNGTTKCKCDLKQKTGDILASDGNVAMSEIQIVSANPTTCLRMDIFINNHLFMENVIANGIIVSTPIGSTGYFKSVARTIFRDGIGVAFICPTYGINNIILKSTDWINVVFNRACKAFMSWDNITSSIDVEKGTTKTIQYSSNVVSLFGYEEFMCPQCRIGRNSTTINDQYKIF
jgi:NAD kinase